MFHGTDPRRASSGGRETSPRPALGEIGRDAAARERSPPLRYFLLMFGLRGFFKVVLGEDPDAMDENRAMQMQMGMASGGGGIFDARGPASAAAFRGFERMPNAALGDRTDAAP